MSTEYILLLSMLMFTGIVVSLVVVILGARAKLVSVGSVVLDINGDAEKRIEEIKDTQGYSAYELYATKLLRVEEPVSERAAENVRS